MDFNKMAFSNFINLNKNTIIDFQKKDNEYKDLFIKFYDEKENIVYAKKGNIFSENNQYNFQLTEGFKISIDDNQQIEKLEFLNYVLKIDYTNLNNTRADDINTYTIFDDYLSKNYLNISFKIVDILLIVYVIFLFYKNNLKKYDFNIYNNIFFSCSCIFIIIFNQILKNSEITIYNYIFVIITIIFLSLLISNIKHKYAKN